jgi:hypothetical protein
MEHPMKADRVVGIAYLLAIPPAIFAQFYVLSRIYSDSAATTAANIAAHEQLFRLGIGANLIDFTIDIVLITALYIALKPVSRPLSLFALLVRMVETTVLFVTLLTDLDALRYLSGAPYLQAVDATNLQTVARFSLAAHGAGYNLGLFLAGLGSTVFCYLWLRSRLMPGWLAILGIVASAILAVCTFSFIVAPDLAKGITVALYGGPIFVFELTAGLLLAFRSSPQRVS